MPESHVVSALTNKRAEIAGMIARAHQQIGQFRARGRAARAGFVSIGFGECQGRIEPAPPWPLAQAKNQH